MAAGSLAGVLVTSGVARIADRLIDNGRHGADFYRSDRFVLAFDGTWTGSDD